MRISDWKLSVPVACVLHSLKIEISAAIKICHVCHAPVYLIGIWEMRQLFANEADSVFYVNALRNFLLATPERICHTILNLLYTLLVQCMRAPGELPTSLRHPREYLCRAED